MGTWRLITQWWPNEPATDHGNATPTAGRNATADAGATGSDGSGTAGSDGAVYGPASDAGSGATDSGPAGSGTNGVDSRAGYGIDADVKIQHSSPNDSDRPKNVADHSNTAKRPDRRSIADAEILKVGD